MYSIRSEVVLGAVFQELTAPQVTSRLVARRRDVFIWVAKYAMLNTDNEVNSPITESTCQASEQEKRARGVKAFGGTSALTADRSRHKH